MRDYSKFRPGYWSDRGFLDLETLEHKLTDVYVRTNRHVNSAGIAFLPREYGAADLCWSPDEFGRRLDYLEQAGRVKIDRVTNEVMVIGWFDDNPPMNESHYRGTSRLAEAISSDALREATKVALADAWAASCAARLGAKSANNNLLGRLKVAK